MQSTSLRPLALVALTFACLLAGAVGGAGDALAAVMLVESHQPKAEVIVSPRATTTEQFAAREFQQAVELMTRARLPVLFEPSGQAHLQIVLGTPDTSDLVNDQQRALADDLAYIGQTDGFAVRLIDQTLYIVGNEPKGVLNGVYSFLEENTSILWYRAGDQGVAYQFGDRIVAEQVSYRERPSFDLRGWLLTSIWRHTHDPTELWMTRNRATYKPTSRETLADVMPTLAKRGMFSEYGGGHNLKFWFPNEPYFEQNPEFFVEIDGVRRPLIGGTRGTQLCFSNLEGRDAFTREVLARMHLVPQGISAIAILIEDNWNICQCSLCQEPITLPDGSLLMPEDDAFRSTQFFTFLNHVAEAVDREHPGMRVATFAYIFTAPPPKVAIAENIYVRFCPFVRSDKHTLHEPINEKWLDRINAWTEVTPHIIWREYYGCASQFPRPLARTVAHDLQYISSLGIRSVFSETPPDAEPTRPGRRRLADSWDVSSMQLWIITRLYWDPTLDVEALKQRYLDRVYESAAPAMADFLI